MRYLLLTGVLVFFGGVVWGQTPVISSFSPASGPYGTPVTITGTNFSTALFGNVVYFGNMRAVVDSCTATKIYVRVPNGAQYKKISVTTGGFTGTSAKLFKVQNPCAPAMYDGSFKSPTPIAASGLTVPVLPELADFDKDGKLDVLTVMSGTASGKVQVWKNNVTTGSAITTAGFSLVCSTTVSGSTSKTAKAVDFDCDGMLDIIVSSNPLNTVSILRSTSSVGSISFTATAVSITTPSAFPIFATGADFDNDGKPDIITVTSAATSYVNVLRNGTTPGSITTSSFTAIAQGPLAISGYASHLDVEDLDGDGKLDIVVACSTASTIRIFRNTTTGTTITFASPVDFVIPSAGRPQAVRLVDMDGDDRPDIIVARNKVSPSSPDSGMNIFRNVISTPGSITASSFASPITVYARYNPSIFDVADMDGDLKPDLVVPCFTGAVFNVLRNASTPGNLTFDYKYRNPESTVSSGGLKPTGSCIGDLNGDNIPDFVIINQGSPSPANVVALEGQKPSVRISALLRTPSCPGMTVGIVYTTTGAPYASGNKFVAYISDNNGSFASPDSLGFKTGTTSDTLYVTIPSDATIGGNYRLLINTTSPVVSCVDTGYAIQIQAPPVVNAGSDTTINVGDSVQLSASGGTSYNWNTSLFLGDTSIANPYAKPYFTQDFVVKGLQGFCSDYDTVRVNVTQNFNFCSVCSPEYPSNDGLVACYPLNGTGIDESGNNYHILFKNVAPAPDKTSAADKAYAFTGSGSWLSRSPMISDVNDSVTMMGWFYSTNGTQNTPLIYVGDNGAGGGYGINLDNCSGAGGNKLNVLVGGTSICGGTSSQLSTNTWTHVALTKAGNTYAIYINGVQVVSGTGTAASISGGSFMIGGSPITGQSFSGRIDEVRVFTKALTASQIQTFFSGSYKRFVQTIADRTICQGDSVNLVATGAITYSWTPNNGVSDIYSSSPWAKPVTPLNASTAVNYIVSGTKTYCTDNDTVRIMVDNFKNFTNAGADVGFCKTPAATASVQLGASFASTYFWTPNYKIDNQSSPVPRVSPDVDTAYVLRATRGVCVGYDTVKVKVDADSNFAEAGMDTFICQGNTAQLFASGGTSYQWSWIEANPPTVIDNQFVAGPVVSPANTTRFIVTVKKGYCTDRDTVQVRVDNFSNFLNVFNFADTIMCIGSASQLWADGADTYKWTPATGLSNDTIPNPVATPTATTTYTVNVTKGGCLASQQVKRTITNFKNFLSASGDTAICPDEFAPLYASGADTYTWAASDGNNGSLTSTSGPNPYAGPSITTKYYVYGRKGACIETDSVLITVGSNSSSSVDAGKDTAICKGVVVQLDGKGNGVFQWESTTGAAGGLSSTTDQDPTAEPTVTTKYYLTIVDTVGVSCEIVDSVTITVYPLPIAKITSPDPLTGVTICEGSDVKLNALAGGLTYTYKWTPNYRISSDNARNPTVDPDYSLYYKVRVSDSRCVDYDSIYVTVTPRPTVDLGPDLTICKTDSVLITPEFDAVTPTFNWTPINTSAQFIKVSPPKKQEYTLWIADGDCESLTDTIVVSVVPKAYASFDLDPLRGASPFKVTFSNTSVGADKYYWYFGDTSGIIGRERDTTFTYIDTGFYQIIMKAENSLGNCSDQDTAYIRVDDFVTFFVPSGFSPNADGKNDRFEVEFSGISQFKGIIYNRWGEIIYEQESTKGKFSWDGLYKGNPVEDGAYYYFFDLSTFGAERKTRSGVIYVLR